MKKYYFLLISLFCFGIGTSKAQYSVLCNFGGSINGAYPYGALTLVGARLYGMTSSGGIYGAGNIFSIDTNGNGFTDLFDFSGVNGSYPSGNLTLAGSKLYGMTMLGGVSGTGNIFSIDTNGNEFNNLFSFFSANNYPTGSLIILGNKLYGVTDGGGLYNIGLIFSIDTNGSNYQDLFDFNNASDGEGPRGDLTLVGNKFYGTTEYGGVYDSGCIFSIDTNGSGYNKVLDFNGANGGLPDGSLILFGSRLYGTTTYGGIYDSGCIFSIDSNGSGYKVLFDFNGSNGEAPINDLLCHEGNMLYGTTILGGALGYGCIFSIDTSGNGFTDLFNFYGVIGEQPSGVICSKNVLYGMTNLGGANTGGVVFAFKDTNISSSTNKLIRATGAVTIYPNPNNGQFTLSLSNINEKCNIEIYSVLGEKVYDGMLKQVQHDYEINISSQLSGIYFYRVISESGALIGEGKIIIDK